jgi:hypothetical protein
MPHERSDIFLSMNAQYFMKGTATEVGISPQMFTTFSSTAWENEVCAKWIPHVLNDDQTAMCVLATTHLKHWKNEGSEFLDHTVIADKSLMQSFHPQLK